MGVVLELQNVSFRFGDVEVLKDVTFAISEGDFVGLIGPNGSGKTTLLKLVLGLYPLQKGSIRIGGVNLGSFRAWNMLGYVPQKATNITQNFPASVLEVVTTGLLSTKMAPKTISSRDREKAIGTLKKVGMDRFALKRIGELSGGQQQRALIARALISEPKLLILDEPTTGVDQTTQKTFYELLGGLNKEGISILLVSHDIGKITHYVTKVASLDKTLEFYGTHREFCRHPGSGMDHHCLSLKRVQ